MVHLNQSDRYRRYQQDISAFISFTLNVSNDQILRNVLHITVCPQQSSVETINHSISSPQKGVVCLTAHSGLYLIFRTTPLVKRSYNCILNSVKRFSCDSKVFGNFSNSLRLHSSASNLTQGVLEMVHKWWWVRVGPYLRWSMKKLYLV